jgi:hypothetical protein
VPLRDPAALTEPALGVVADENIDVAEKLNANEIKFSVVRTKEQLDYLKNKNITTIVDHRIGDIDYQFIFTKYKTR